MEKTALKINSAWLQAARRRAAYHESGHAVMAMACGCSVNSLWINTDIDGGSTEIIPPPSDSEINLVRRVLLAAAGAGAELAFFRDSQDELDGGILGFRGDEIKAEPDLTRLGQKGAFYFYIAIASSILQSPAYSSIVVSLAEAVLQLGVIPDVSQANALTGKVPILETEILELYRKSVNIAYSSTTTD